MRLWLMKSEPDVFSIQDLERQGQSIWEGVRNYQARNWMREMRLGDLALFYHSNATPPGVVGIGRILREAYPDPFQHDAKSDYYDPKSPLHEPRWSAIDLGFVERLPREVTLESMKADPGLAGMKVLEKGSRLSVTPVDLAHFVHVLGLGGSALTLPV